MSGTPPSPEDLADLPHVPPGDPVARVLTDPEVPQRQRFCWRCKHHVGRDGQPAGTCSLCGARFSFAPKLRPGDVVDGRYDVHGCLARGGLGWIYLATDRRLDDQPVVLKGLLDTGDEQASKASKAEKRALIDIEHPNIVRIADFVVHPDSDAEYEFIVMDYVGGESLRDVLRRAQPSPALAIAYVLKVLAALEHLHEHNGLLYCDLKPENVLHVEREVKLIDLGAARRVGDPGATSWGSPGYLAPEVRRGHPPTVRSDIYAAGRLLAVLALGITPVDADGGETLLPDPPAGQESLYRLLVRATAAEPTERFTTAAQLAEQLRGVLREVRARDDGRPYPATSTLFGAERAVAGAALAHDDGGPLDPEEAAAALPVPLADAETVLPDDWRGWWYQGVHQLSIGQPLAAHRWFNRCHALLPGELAPKLAAAFSLDCAGHPAEAAVRYETVWRTDHGTLSAAFGLARTRPDAVEVLAEVPPTASSYPDAQLALTIAPLRRAHKPSHTELSEARERLKSLSGLTAHRRARLDVELLRAMLDNGDDERLRQELSTAYRVLARYTPTAAERWGLVDEANRVRPWRWW